MRPQCLPPGYHLQAHMSVREIQAETAAWFTIPAFEMTSDRRSRKITRPRQVAMYLARELTPYSLPAIGRFFGNRDHTTVMHAIRVVEGLISEDSEFTHTVKTLKDNLVSAETAKAVDNSKSPVVQTAAMAA